MGGYSFQLEYSIFSPKSKVHFMQPILKRVGCFLLTGGLIINTVDCKKTEKPMPKLPVATNFWTPQPDLYTGAEAWILAGGAHHTAFTYDLTAEQMGEWATMMGIEAVFIDNDTTIRNFKKDLMLGNIFYK